MKTLILARHAKSSWKNADIEDFDRPLNGRGEKQLPIMAERLRNHFPNEEILILSSPAKRAIDTAAAYAEALGNSRSEIVEDINIYEKGTRYIIEQIVKYAPKCEVLMITGHNPDITSTASFTTGEYFDNVPTGAMVIVDYDKDITSADDIDKGKLRIFDIPPKKRDLT